MRMRPICNLQCRRDEEASQPRPAGREAARDSHGPPNDKQRLPRTWRGAAATAHCVTMHDSLDPAVTGSGLAGRLALLAPAGPCCFQLDELRVMLLRIGAPVKRKVSSVYVTPL